MKLSHKFEIFVTLGMEYVRFHTVELFVKHLTSLDTCFSVEI